MVSQVTYTGFVLDLRIQGTSNLSMIRTNASSMKFETWIGCQIIRLPLCICSKSCPICSPVPSSSNVDT